MPSSQYGPLGDGAIRHFGVPSAFTTARPSSIMSAVKVVYQKICWAMWPWAGTGPASEKVMPDASGGANRCSHSMYLVSANTDAGALAAPPRDIDDPTGRQPSTRMPHSSTGTPLGRPLSPVPAMDSQASVKHQPRDG